MTRRTLADTPSDNGGQRHVCRYCPAIINRYESGLSTLDVAAAVGLSDGMVRYYLKLHGVTLRDPRVTGRYHRAPWADEAERRYRAGETLRELSKAFGVSFERVRQILRQRGVPTRPRPRGHRCDDICAAILAATPPVNTNEIARQCGCGGDTAVTRARYHGVPYGAGRHFYINGRRRHGCDDRCEQFRALLAAGTPRTHIARLLGLTPSHVSVIFPANHPEWPWFDGRRKRAQSLAPATNGSAT